MLNSCLNSADIELEFEAFLRALVLRVSGGFVVVLRGVGLFLVSLRFCQQKENYCEYGSCPSLSLEFNSLKLGMAIGHSQSTAHQFIYRAH